MSGRILIVEDDKDIQRNLRRLFEREGYIVDLAGNGKEALSVLNAMPEMPGVIILDLMMPIMDGFQFRAEQEKDAKLSQIPVIIMTADGHVDEKKAKVNAIAALKKPTDIDTILQTVKTYYQR